MIEFSVPRPNLYQCSDGYSVEVLGQTGLRYREAGRSMFVDSEILAAPAGIAVYCDTVERWEAPHEAEIVTAEQRRRILDNVVAALRSQSIPVDLL